MGHIALKCNCFSFHTKFSRAFLSLLNLRLLTNPINQVKRQWSCPALQIPISSFFIASLCLCFLSVGHVPVFCLGHVSPGQALPASSQNQAVVA